MLIAASALFFVYGLAGYYTSYVIEKKDKSSRIAWLRNYELYK